MPSPCLSILGQCCASGTDQTLSFGEGNADSGVERRPRLFVNSGHVQTTNTEMDFDRTLDRGSSRGFPDVLHFSDPAPESFALVMDETIHHGDLVSAGDPARDLQVSHWIRTDGSP